MSAVSLATKGEQEGCDGVIKRVEGEEEEEV